MSQRYRAYLPRHWHLADGQERAEVQHIQPGECARHPTLADACAWLTARARDPPPDAPAAAAFAAPSPGDGDDSDKTCRGQQRGATVSTPAAKEGTE